MFVEILLSSVNLNKFKYYKRKRNAFSVELAWWYIVHSHALPDALNKIPPELPIEKLYILNTLWGTVDMIERCRKFAGFHSEHFNCTIKF